MVGVAAAAAAVDNLGAAAELAGGTEEDSASSAKDRENIAQDEQSGCSVALSVTDIVVADIGLVETEIDRTIVDFGRMELSIVYEAAGTRFESVEFVAGFGGVAAGVRLQVDVLNTAFAAHSAVVGTGGVEGRNYCLEADSCYPIHMAS